MLCQRCGNEIAEGANYCVRCGTKSFRNEYLNEQPVAAATKTAETANISAPVSEVGDVIKRYNETIIDESPLRTGQYFWLMLVALIPIINFVTCIAWAFGPTRNINIKNFAKSVLIWLGIGMAFIGFTLMFVLYFTLAR